jgi:hypothetical protein
MTAGRGPWSFFKNCLLNSLILLMLKNAGTAVACYSATSCGWWWWKDEEDGKRKQFRWGTTGKKTDNKDFATKNPDKWGAENNENDLDSIERTVKDDDPAKAGFFLFFRFENRNGGQPDRRISPHAICDAPGITPAIERRCGLR